MQPRIFHVIAVQAFFASAIAIFQPPVLAQATMSISAGVPGYYGQVIVGTPVIHPRGYYQGPIILDEHSSNPNVQPILINLPEYQANHWSDYCHLYRACWRPVYLRVSDSYSHDEFWRGRWWHHHADD